MLVLLSLFRLRGLEEFASKVDRAQRLAGDSPSAHLFNPVNAFQLVNRYSNGWMKLHDKLYEDNAKGKSYVFDKESAIQGT